MVRRTRLLTMLLVVAGLLVAVSGGWFAATGRYEQQFEEAVDALHAAGGVVDIGQFDRPRAPEAENAAPLIIEARAWRRASELESCDATEDVDGDQAWEQIGGWVDAQAHYFELIDRAVLLPHSDFNVGYREHWNTVVESIPISMELTNAYDWRTRVAEHRGEPATDSLSNCTTLLRWARHVDGAFLIGYSVKTVVDRQACLALRRVARMREFDATVARSTLEPLLRAAENDKEFRTALAMERASMIAMIRKLAASDGLTNFNQLLGQPNESPIKQRAVMTAMRPLIWRDGLAGLGFYANAERIIEAGGTDVLAQLRALQATMQVPKGSVAVTRLAHYVSSLCAMVPPKGYEMRLRQLAHVRVARVGLACLDHRQRIGAWPADLTSLFPDGVPLDPYTGQPLKLEEPARVATVGPEEEPIAWEL